VVEQITYAIQVCVGAVGLITVAIVVGVKLWDAIR
jgi:hypothetical protein